MSLAGAVRWTLSSRIFTSMVSVGAPGMANSTTSLWPSLSPYDTVLGATLIRSSGILAPYVLDRLFQDFHCDIRHVHCIPQKRTLRPHFRPRQRYLSRRRDVDGGGRICFGQLAIRFR